MKKKFKKKRVVISEKLKPVRPRASSLLHVKKERADIVGKLKSIRPLNDTEKIRLKKTLKKIEAAEYYGGGWNRVPGGFATAKVGDADMETIDVHLEAGVKGGKTDTMKIDVDRKSMDVIGDSRITNDSTEITCKIVRMGGKDIQVCYNDKKEVEVYSGKNHIVDSSDPSHSKKYDLKETPPKYKVVVDELIKAHNNKSIGSEKKSAVVVDTRMYNFLEDDLKKLEEAINEGNKEEVERFFSYWGQHLKSLKTKTNDRMYNFLKEDLEKLEKAIGEGDKEEVERFFSYWGQHLKSLKMEHGGSVETDGEISDNKRPSGLKRLSDYELYSWEDKPYHSPEEIDRVHRNKIIVSSLEDAIKKATEMSSAKKYVEVYKRDEFVGSSRNGNKFIYGHNYRKHHPEAMGGSMATGGSIPNNYAGKKYSEVWDSWNHEQKKHFLLDHLNHELMPNRNEDAIKKITSKSSKEIADIIYSPNSIRDGVDYGNIHNYLISHVEQGQYSSGGSMATGGGVKFDKFERIKQLGNLTGDEARRELFKPLSNKQLIAEANKAMRRGNWDDESAELRRRYDESDGKFDYEIQGGMGQERVVLLKDESSGGSMATGGEIDSVRKLYDKYQSKYPNASDLIAYFIFGNKEDDNIVSQNRNKYSELSELALDYEFNWQYNMSDIENSVNQIIEQKSSGGSMATGGIVEVGEKYYDKKEKVSVEIIKKKNGIVDVKWEDGKVIPYSEKNIKFFIDKNIWKKLDSGSMEAGGGVGNEYASGGKVKHSDLIKKIDAQIKKHKADEEYDEYGEEINKIYKQFEKEVFKIEDDEEASEYLLGATTPEALEYLKERIQKLEGKKMAFGGVIGDKRAQQIASDVVSKAKKEGIELPNLANLASQGALPGNALEAYEEFKFWVNNGDNPNSLRLPYDDSVKFVEYIKSRFPNKTQRGMMNNYGSSAIQQAFPNYASGGKIEIPRLKKDASWKEVKEYLEWLGKSPYAYHIDDNPADVFDDKKVIEVLTNNSDIMWEFSTDGKKGSKLWDVYYPAAATAFGIEESE